MKLYFFICRYFSQLSFFGFKESVQKKYERNSRFAKKLKSIGKTDKEILTYFHKKGVSMSQCVLIFTEIYDCSLEESREKINSFQLWSPQINVTEEFLRIVNEEDLE